MERLNFNIDRIPNALDSSSGSSDFDSDEEVRVIRYQKHRNNLLEELNEDEFKKRFRMNKRGVERLAALLDDNFQPRNNRNHPVSKINQVLICLRYYATGTFQINIGDLFGVSQPTVSRIVEKITRAITDLRPNFIDMPANEADTVRTIQAFHRIAGFPNVIGCVDCTHIRIKSPGGENAEMFRNRKGWFSINTQVVGNADLQINDIVARWPGSVHDSTIFNDSLIRARFENGNFGNKYMLGDSGYGCRQYLLTPLQETRNNPQQRYNTTHIQTRNSVERLFGVWKRRFPCLSLGINLQPEKACEIIVATAVLHNMCVAMRDVLPEELLENEIPDGPFPNGNDHIHRGNENFAMRNAVINTVFSD